MTKSGITVRLYEENVSNRSAVTILKAAWGVVIMAKPITPEASIANATGILVNKNPNRIKHPKIPM